MNMMWRISVLWGCFLLLVTTFCEMSNVTALPNCSFPAVYSFGDSLTDNGNAIAALPDQFALSESNPYGLLFPHHAADRYCDGRLLVDYIGNIHKLQRPRRLYNAYIFLDPLNCIWKRNVSTLTLYSAAFTWTHPIIFEKIKKPLLSHSYVIIYSLQPTFWYYAYLILTREQPLLWGGGPTMPSWGESQQTSRTAPTSLLQDRLHATALFGNQTLVSIVHFHWTYRSRGYIVTEFALNSTTARTVSHAIYISTAVLSGCSAYWPFDSWKYFLCTVVVLVELVCCILWRFRAFFGCDDLYRRVRFSALNRTLDHGRVSN